MLILANLMLFVWAQGFLGPQEEGREPQRLAMQIAPERLRVEVIESSPATLPPAAEACRLVRGLAPNEAQHLLIQAKGKLPDLKTVVKASQARAILYWIYIPPQPSRFAVDRKLEELKKLGVTNFSAMLDEGADKFAISLGLFNTEKEANQHLQELLKRGVRSAKMQMRENLLDKDQLEVRGPADLLEKQLSELLSGQTNARTTDCPTGP
ncbi:MAG: hypothetical protein PHQ05_10925 [Sterolibacterium sp.]|nr:hypothetical protein [Sterolibacterium sp.]